MKKESFDGLPEVSGREILYPRICGQGEDGVSLPVERG